MGTGRTYEGANGAACSDGGDGSSADIAGDATAGGEGGENEGDVVEGLVKLVSAGRDSELPKAWRQAMRAFDGIDGVPL